MAVIRQLVVLQGWSLSEVPLYLHVTDAVLWSKKYPRLNFELLLGFFFVLFFYYWACAESATNLIVVTLFVSRVKKQLRLD